MLENTNPLPTMFSDLQVLLDASTFLADLHPVCAITAQHLATTPPPPSVLHAGILASHCWVKQLQSSPIPRGYVLAVLSMPALRRVCLWYTSQWVEATKPLRDNPLPNETRLGQHTITFWSSVSAAFTCLGLTTLQSQVSFVSIDRRGSPSFRFGSDRRYIVSRLRTLSSATAQRTLLTPHIIIQMLPSEATRPPVRGRTFIEQVCQIYQRISRDVIIIGDRNGHLKLHGIPSRIYYNTEG
jgi:hypothetical protein